TPIGFSDRGPSQLLDARILGPAQPEIRTGAWVGAILQHTIGHQIAGRVADTDDLSRSLQKRGEEFGTLGPDLIGAHTPDRLRVQRDDPVEVPRTEKTPMQLGRRVAGHPICSVGTGARVITSA